ncbi:MAG: short-chain dehydrogenase [Robiginitomaculum sp.]|nr:MAG: short-chain dehydrogenase [Robiginitomaculum sp.]
MAQFDFDLSGKIAFVNGASRGIGAAVAHGLAARGAHVICASRKLDGCSQVAQSIIESGGKAEALACHAGHMDQITAAIEHVRREHGRLDILINNAATNPYFGPATDTPEGAFDKTIEVNLKGPFFFCAQAIPLMKEGGGGAIVNVASINAIEPGLYQAVYSMTKAALINMTKALAKENARDKIRVNALLPGFTDTKMTAVFKADEDNLKAMLDENVPYNRMAQPDEMVGAVLYLVSDEASYTTGAQIVVDGGYLL